MMPQSRSIAVALANRFVEYGNKIDEIANQLRQYKNVIDLCPLPMFLADENGNCVYVNQAMERVMDEPLEKIQYNFWQEHLHPDDRPATVTAWTTFVKDAACRVYEYQHRYVRPNGSCVTVLVKARQMPCNSIVGFAIPTNFPEFTEWLRGADLGNLPPLPAL